MRRASADPKEGGLHAHAHENEFHRSSEDTEFNSVLSRLMARDMRLKLTCVGG